ncbi:hypothetical protein EI53_01106 [Fusobacterium naviforme]|nr:hypothetical protein EI53_01106 [Fusobacterium naviforme]STO28178.1 Uncharacterised protein [Fusobacterium naviforme]
MYIERLQALVTKMEDMNRTDTDTLNDDFKFLITTATSLSFVGEV